MVKDDAADAVIKALEELHRAMREVNGIKITGIEFENDQMGRRIGSRCGFVFQSDDVGPVQRMFDFDVTYKDAG